MPCEKGVSAPSNLCTEQLESGMVGVGRGIATVPLHMLQFSMSDPEHTSTMLEKSSPNIRGALSMLRSAVSSTLLDCCDVLDGEEEEVTLSWARVWAALQNFVLGSRFLLKVANAGQ